MAIYTIFILLRDTTEPHQRQEIEAAFQAILGEYDYKKLSSFEFEFEKDLETKEERPLWRDFRNATRDNCYIAFYNHSKSHLTIPKSELHPSDDTFYTQYIHPHTDTPLQYCRDTLAGLLREKRGLPLEICMSPKSSNQG